MPKIRQYYIIYQRYTKGIQKDAQYNLQHSKTFSKKHTHSEVLIILQLPHVVYVFITTKSTNIQHKSTQKWDLYTTWRKLSFIVLESTCNSSKKQQNNLHISCVFEKITLPLHPHSVKGSRWESYTDPLLWFAISFVLNLSHCLSGGKAKQTSNKSEDLLHDSWTLSRNRA